LFFSLDFRWQDRIDFFAQTPEFVYGHHCDIPILHVVPHMRAMARRLAADLAESRPNYVIPMNLTFKSSGTFPLSKKPQRTWKKLLVGFRISGCHPMQDQHHAFNSQCRQHSRHRGIAAENWRLIGSKAVSVFQNGLCNRLEKLCAPQ
jgi:hypothetical protein